MDAMSSGLGSEAFVLGVLVYCGRYGALLVSGAVWYDPVVDGLSLGRCQVLDGLVMRVIDRIFLRCLLL